jgi:hypothetical protein
VFFQFSKVPSVTLHITFQEHATDNSGFQHLPVLQSKNNQLRKSINPLILIKTVNRITPIIAITLGKTVHGLSFSPAQLKFI